MQDQRRWAISRSRAHQSAARDVDHEITAEHTNLLANRVVRKIMQRSAAPIKILLLPARLGAGPAGVTRQGTLIWDVSGGLGNGP